MYVVIVSRSSAWNGYVLVGSAPPVIWSGSLTSYVACLLLCKNIFMGISYLALCAKSFIKLFFSFMFSSTYLTLLWMVQFFPAMF
jgi:hypothetical protein